MPLLIRQAPYPLKVNKLLPSYVPDEVVSGLKFSNNPTICYYECNPESEISTPSTPRIEISQTNLSNATIFNIDQYEKIIIAYFMETKE